MRRTRSHEVHLPCLTLWPKGDLESNRSVRSEGLPHYRRNPATTMWDPEWWRYEEVGTLMETLWGTWEKMRWDGAGGIAAYFRDYLYPLMDRITAPVGPFWAYDPPLKQDVPEKLSTVPAPEGFYV